MIINEIKSCNYITKSQIAGVDLVCNPYVGCPHKCVYCYADFMRRFTHHSEDWGEFLDVKFCEKKITAKQLEGKLLMFGSVTDAYNSYEKRYRITRKILEQLLPLNPNFGILTKSDLILRDLDILKKFKNLKVTFSFSSLDENFAKLVEPRAPSPARRLEALKILHKEGIACSVFIAPIFPKITSVKELIDAAAPSVDEMWFDSLNLHAGTVSAKVFAMLERNYPQLVPLYTDIYKNYNDEFFSKLYPRIEAYCAKKKIDCKIYF